MLKTNRTFTKEVRKVQKVIRESIERGKIYLLSMVADGPCLEFHQLRHGPSYAWTTACVGSTLSEFNAVPPVLQLQQPEGGWAYNPSVPPDADSTLRVMQFLHKIKFEDKIILQRAEQFVLAHQQADGGFATYLQGEVDLMEYQSVDGWLSSHPCVTALALNQIQSTVALRKARFYLKNHLARFGPISYWWITPFYILYEMGLQQNMPLVDEDTIEVSLSLLLKSKLGLLDTTLIYRLLTSQQENGSFPPSQQFRIPRPHQQLSEIDGSEEKIKDAHGVFSTSAAIVALFRQIQLLQN